MHPLTDKRKKILPEWATPLNNIIQISPIYNMGRQETISFVLTITITLGANIGVAVEYCNDEGLAFWYPDPAASIAVVGSGIYFVQSTQNALFVRVVMTPLGTTFSSQNFPVVHPSMAV